MFEAHLAPPSMLYLAAALLLVTAGLFLLIDKSANASAARQQLAPAEATIGGKNGFTLVFASPYIRLIALLLVLLNVVNTIGEFILSHMVTVRAEALLAADPAFDKGAYIGAFYGDYFFWVNVAALVMQAFVASRLVKRFGLAGVLFALPLIALGSYGTIALGATLSVVRWAKTAENSTDYSVMNTAKQLLWLPTSREEKYKAKQAVDAFFYRLGDLVAAAVVFVGTSWLVDGLARLRDREPAVRDRVARARGAHRPREPAPLAAVGTSAPSRRAESSSSQSVGEPRSCAAVGTLSVLTAESTPPAG